jgi:acyl-coenzyme A synthetase/AMP-(fatty) acid ligase
MKKPLSPEAFLPLKPHWVHVMLCLAGHEQHGYGIMQEVLERTGGKVRLWPATLYGTLKRLAEEDLMMRAGATIALLVSAGACWPPKARDWRTWSA